jgi:transcriptional regulator with XRE-family HTH domain/mannose-6-phosphate isomerase-like protein (cupin superfamily)
VSELAQDLLQDQQETSETLTAASGESAQVSPERAEAAIEAKRLGERIKFLRQRKHMGLVELGKHTGLSASFLSQLETGRVVPTLRNLARIAMVFSRDLSFFFEPEKPEMFRLIRAADRQRMPQTGADDPAYFFESLGHVPGLGGGASFTNGGGGQRIAPYIAEFLAASDSRPPKSHRHHGMEFLYVLSGKLQLTHEGKAEVFEEGDALYFDASTTHSYECAGEGPCTALILTMPEGERAATPYVKTISAKPKSATPRT